MPDTCAKCGADARRELPIPADWEEYLRDERGYTPIGAVRIPLCPDCYPEMDQLKSATAELGYYDEEDRESLREEIDTALDALDLDRLTDTAL